MVRMPVLGWLALSFLSFVGSCYAFLIGHFVASGKDIDETCGRAGQVLDRTYRRQNWDEPAKLFPIHNKCNAMYDMIPAWVNPTLAICFFLTLIFLCIFIIMEYMLLKANRQRSIVNEDQ